MAVEARANIVRKKQRTTQTDDERFDMAYLFPVPSGTAVLT
jgi:hypothetical protein